MERERFPRAALHSASGQLGIRPAGPMPVREELAALVPERVLPFASGDSRKRGPSCAPRRTAWGGRGRAPRGEHAGHTARAVRHRTVGETRRLSALVLPVRRGGFAGEWARPGRAPRRGNGIALRRRRRRVCMACGGGGRCGGFVAAIAVVAPSPQPSPRRGEGARCPHHLPVFGIDSQGSFGGSAVPFCKSSIDCLSGERTKAIMPSRGGRLMVTPACISRSHSA